MHNINNKMNSNYHFKYCTRQNCVKNSKPPMKSFDDMQRIALSMEDCPLITLLTELLCFNMAPNLLKNAILQEAARLTKCSNTTIFKAREAIGIGFDAQLQKISNLLGCLLRLKIIQNYNLQQSPSSI